MTYDEDVTIDKELTVQSENGSSTAIIEGIVSIEASSSTLSGFSITADTNSDVTAVTIDDGPYDDVTVKNNRIFG
jgi:PKD repeat protein